MSPVIPSNLGGALYNAIGDHWRDEMADDCFTAVSAVIEAHIEPVRAEGWLIESLDTGDLFVRATSTSPRVPVFRFISEPRRRA